MPGSELAVPRTTGLIDFCYHEIAGRYAGGSSTDRLAGSAASLAAQLARGQEVYAFFDNNMNGDAVVMPKAFVH